MANFPRRAICKHTVGRRFSVFGRETKVNCSQHSNRFFPNSFTVSGMECAAFNLFYAFRDDNESVGAVIFFQRAVFDLENLWFVCHTGSSFLLSMNKDNTDKPASALPNDGQKRLLR